MKILVARDECAASKEIAHQIIMLLKRNPSMAIGLASGKTMIPVYAELVRIIRRTHVSVKNAQFFMIDEYIKASQKESFNAFLDKHLFSPLKINEKHIHRLTPETKPYLYEKEIKKAALGIILLGVGHNGHIAFNEPGSSKYTETRIVNLTMNTRRIKSNFFGKKAPKKAITIGVGTILHSKKIILAAFGENKAKIVGKMIFMRPSSKLPASFLKIHKDATIVLDKKAASQLKKSFITKDNL